MNDHRDNSTDSVSERAELLICRRLDGELNLEDARELELILAHTPAARRMLADYERLDGLAAAALRADSQNAKTAVAPRRTGGFRLAAAGAVLTAAAVVALSFLPNLWRASRTGDGQVALDQGRVAPTQTMGTPSSTDVAPQFVDYRNMNYQPSRRQQDVLRDVIGVRAKDQKNRDVIYIFERNSEATRIIPISGDF
ncbi:MAG: hypothetical protein HS101_17780 [Planctomycetia bacterium]|jgi:anti-sigma factor RsiW|nr:hypothetical protein [Planctomycetia bacterium]MCC7314775.1 hypothetical protein [Planctomycetota bacterium]OQY99070.1 MAG: hypothetical protein B6D36_16695 [Planctomycetes bacterium UTPLA1]